MKKDKRTKAQLLGEIKVLESKISLLEACNDQIRREYEGEDTCRKSTQRENKLYNELSEIGEVKNVFKDSLKFILRNVKH